MLRKGKLEQFQKVTPPHKYKLDNNKQNALPTAYCVYIIIRIFLNADENLGYKVFPLESKDVHNITILKPKGSHIEGV